MNASYPIGVIGLGVMGQNLALNLQRNGFDAAGYDQDAAKLAQWAQRVGDASRAFADLAQFVAALQAPRRILMMVPAGAAVDALIAALTPVLTPGDILIDGGNTLFSDTQRRIDGLRGTGLLYIGTGVSGGEEGALWGPAIMPGGDPQAWEPVRPMLQAIAAKTDDGTPCCDWVGPGGAGHFVKMVHNGIEYGDMQMICEAYWLMQQLLGMTPAEIGAVLADWNRGELHSYLIDISAQILQVTDPDTGEPLVLKVLDTAEQKGTGKWTSQVALDLGVPAPTIADAVFARTLSAIKAERVAASSILGGPVATALAPEHRSALIEQIRRALFAAKICSYAQGFQLLQAADQAQGWGLQLDRIAGLWRAGCIIRAQFLTEIQQAYRTRADLPNLLIDPHFAAILSGYQADWRAVVALAASHGVAIPALMSALAYYDGYRSARLPANLLQAQRDCFGAHTYQRVDKPGVFHTDWLGATRA